jgi:hypothetical protein
MTVGASSRPAASRTHTHKVVRQPISDGVIAVGVFLSLLALYLAVSPHRYVAYDSGAMAAVTHNLVNHFTLKTTGAFHDVFGTSTPYSDYGLGLSLALVPFYAISKVTGYQGFWEALLNPLMVAASGAVAYFIGRSLGWRRSLAVVCAVVYGTLTMALPYTTELLSEAGVGLCVALLVLAILRWRQGWWWSPVLFGCALGAAIQFRSDSIVTVGVAVLALPLLVPMRQLLSRHALVGAGVPLFASLALLFWYNDLRFGSIFVTSYHGQGYTTPLLPGLRGLYLSPSKSFFVFNLIAIVGVVGLLVMARRRPRVAVLFLLLIVARSILFAKWADWAGGVSWGPRFLMPLALLFTVAAFDLLAQTRPSSLLGLTARFGVCLACLASVPIAFASVRVPYYQWWNTLRVPQVRAGLIANRELIDNGWTGDLLRSYTWVVRDSEIVGDYRLLGAHRAQMDPAFWRDHLAWVGWALLVAFAVGTLAVVAMAQVSDQRESASGRGPPGSSSRDHAVQGIDLEYAPPEPAMAQNISNAVATRPAVLDFYPRSGNG